MVESAQVGVDAVIRGCAVLTDDLHSLDLGGLRLPSHRRVHFVILPTKPLFLIFLRLRLPSLCISFLFELWLMLWFRLG